MSDFTTTRARAWALVREDGTVMGFTDHDRDLAFDGITFHAGTGMSASAIVQGTGLAVDNTEAAGALSDAALTEEDILAGLYDGAALTIWEVDWADPQWRRILFRGSLGEITRLDGAFKADLRGLTEPLSKGGGRVFGALCPAVLGDAACGFDLSQPGFFAEVALAAVGEGGAVLDLPELSEIAAGWFVDGTVRFLTGRAQGMAVPVRREEKAEEVLRLHLWSLPGFTPAPGDWVRVEAGCGKRFATCRAREYSALKPQLMGAVLDSFTRLGEGVDLVIVEGAGSPAEVNLRAGDIANMGFAQAAGVPVVLVGDIDRGGVIAQMVGTQAVLDPADNALIRGFLINKFRGDPRLFDDGYSLIAQRTGWQGLGVLPWFAQAHRLPAEDAADLRRRGGDGAFRIVVPQLNRIANFDDLDPLMAEPGVSVEIIAPGHPLPVEADLILIPGSKSTIADLAHLRTQGWDIDLFAALRRGARVLGLCGGYQMLGKVIADPEGIEGAPGSVPGLGLLDVETVMSPDKRVTLTEAVHVASGEAAQGYEIHIGRTEGPDRARPLFMVDGLPEGAMRADGRVMGSYLHGQFSADRFRRAFLRGLGAQAGTGSYGQGVEEALEALADHLEEHADCEGLMRIAQAGV
ncbi:MAG: cobyric acid synthase [Pararhodobacter sp.]